MVPSSSIVTTGDGVTTRGAINAAGTSGWAIRSLGTCILRGTAIANGMGRGFTCGPGMRILPNTINANGMARAFSSSLATCILRIISIASGTANAVISSPDMRIVSGATIMVTTTTGSGRALTS